MLYVPFLDPRNPDRMKLLVKTGRTVRVEYLLPGKTRTVKFTMLASDYKAFLDASANWKHEPEVINADAGTQPEVEVARPRRGRPPKQAVGPLEEPLPN